MRYGALAGLRVIELEGQGPCPHAGMILTQFGAEVVRVERPGSPPSEADEASNGRARGWGRPSIELDLKKSVDLDGFFSLVAQADVLMEGYRPGVAERLGIGPAVCVQRNPRLIYARMTGWGQGGPLASVAGHDINYLAITGALNAIGHAGGRPVPPLNLVGDFGGGSMFLVAGVLGALLERTRSGLGQVLDIAIVDGVEILAANVWDRINRDEWVDRPQANLLDSGAPFYDTYLCAEGKYMAVGAIEPKFFRRLLELLELPAHHADDQYNKQKWPSIRQLLANRFITRSRESWANLFEGEDACVSPVLSFAEAKGHPQIVERRTLVTSKDGQTIPGPCPRYSRSSTVSLQDFERLALPPWVSSVLKDGAP